MQTNRHMTQHTLNLRTLEDTRSRDKLFVRFNSEASKLASAERGCEVSCYDVDNKTKQTAYRVELFVMNGRKFGRCDCLARVVCKHILRAILLHVARKRAAQNVKA
jgi:hypothetical protein